MSVPRIESRFLLCQTLLLVHVDVGLLPFSVQVFAQQIQNCVDALVWVMLLVVIELWSILSQDPFEKVWSHNWTVHVPHLVQRFRVCLHQATLGAKWVFDFKIVDKFEFLVEEVFCQFVCVWKTLQARVHVASIAEVWQTHNTFSSCCTIMHLNFAQFWVHLSPTLWDMPPLVVFKAFGIAIPDPFAFANNREQLVLGAPLAFAKKHSRHFGELVGKLILVSNFNQNCLVEELLFLYSHCSSEVRVKWRVARTFHTRVHFCVLLLLHRPVLASHNSFQALLNLIIGRD